MLRFLLIIVLMCIIFKVSQYNVYIGFGIYLFLAASFMAYTSNTVDQEYNDYERELLRTKEGRDKYYYIINSQ